MGHVPNVASIADSVNSRPEAITLSKGVSVTRAKQPVYDSAYKGEQINKDLRLRSVDVLFILDATMSMQPVMDVTKSKIKEIATQIMKSDGYELRVGYVAYRDFDIEPGAQFLPFTYDLKAFVSSVEAVEAHSRCKGQLDEPEDVFTGLEMALGMDWKSRVRAVIHIGDAPAHGKAFHDFGPGRDNFINGDPEGRNLKDMLRFLRVDCKVGLYMFLQVPSPRKTIDTKKMVAAFKEAAAADEWIQDKELHEMQEDFVSGVLDAVHSSIVRSKSGC
ncbi:hypothetical protein DUNSADRAFT_14510 [Dunaliella salina]|nr:hypothetical protein DUNSADRAFT_14510 [Dunaliella salina]|eukprot:KAF5830507.1 hypothetical protein DUNSADRAFT_14510 [Dunaliella salina]